jgi:tetratricopeptide (TPR) repeat protein
MGRKSIMDKSLAPLIAVIALVILLTVIIINSDFSNVTETKEEKLKQLPPKVQLRPESNEYPFSTNSSKQNDDASLLINIDETLGKAKNLLAGGKPQEAEEILRTLLVFDPDHSQALSLLAGILFYSNRYAEAEVIFRKQIVDNPKNHLAYNRLGATLAKQKKYKEAIDNSSIALGISPESGQAHINLAGMYSVVGKKEKALKHFQEAHRLLGYAILPLSYDEAFDNIRSNPEFQNIISQAHNKAEKRKEEAKKKAEPAKKPLFNSGE